ncbi:MAG: SOS response-associated peptidase [Rhodospirillales bacterium]|nr:SOS response-associated peptidase [Rhodospirillales bacterium]
MIRSEAVTGDDIGSDRFEQPLRALEADNRASDSYITSFGCEAIAALPPVATTLLALGEVLPTSIKMCGRLDQLLFQGRTGAAGRRSPRRWLRQTGRPVAVVHAAAGRDRRLEAMRWGLVPVWAKDVAIGARMINARAESLVEKPAFRDALQRRRCLIPADGFYEWRNLPGVGAAAQVPDPKTDDRPDPPPAFAGLWDRWFDPTGTELLSCTIITTEANVTIRPLHDRMPALLDPSEQEAWLDVDGVGAKAATALLRPWDAARMEVRPVSSWVNAVAHEGPRCIEPLAEPGSSSAQGLLL